mgnify:CR=1 FL=1
MRSLCAVLLAAVFLVGFTAEADDPEPDNPESIIENSTDTEQVLLEVGVIKLLNNSENALDTSAFLNQCSQKSMQASCQAVSCEVEGTPSSCCLIISGDMMCAPCGAHFPILQ